MASKELVGRITEAEFGFMVSAMSETIENDREIFTGLRACQFGEWSEAAAESYLSDLERAKADGDNPMLDKCVYMVRFTAPEEYEKMAHLAPPVSEEKAALVCEVCGLMLSEAEKCREAYPSIGGGQGLYSSSDDGEKLSAETSWKGELGTYSEATLRLLKEHIESLNAAGESLTARVLEATVRRAGHKDLAEANDAAAEEEKNAKDMEDGAVFVQPNFGCPFCKDEN